MLAALVFLTPAAALVAAAVLLPLAAFVLAERRVATVRRLLELRPPRGRVDVPSLASLAAVVLVLALAAAQPALSHTRKQHVRTDAEVLFLLDVSRSMAASSGRRGSTRLERATSAATRLRSSIQEVPCGVATLTDRILPNLLPVPGAAAFDATVEQTVAIDEPPPRELNVRATNFAALSAIPSSGYFSPSATQRAVVLLTDGESSFFDAALVGRAFAAAPRTRFFAVHFWHGGEAIYNAAGKTDPNYRPDPASKAQLAALAGATHGQVFAEADNGRAAAALRALLGRGPTRSVGRTQSRHPLAPYVALLALLPLGMIFARNLRLPGSSRVHAPERAGTPDKGVTGLRASRAPPPARGPRS
jgi:hypothetical protein